MQMPNMNRQTEKAANGISESGAAQSRRNYSRSCGETYSGERPVRTPAVTRLFAGLIARRYVTENILNFKAIEHRDKFAFKRFQLFNVNLVELEIKEAK